MFKNNFFEKPCADPEGGGVDKGFGPPWKITKKIIGFLSNSGPDPLKITKLPIQHSMLGHHGPPAKRQMAFRWRAVDGPLIVVFGSFLLSSNYKKEKKNFVKVGPPLTILSGAAHAK